MPLLRRFPADIRAGFWACRDLLLWGQVYPSHCPVRVPPSQPGPGSGE